MPFFLFSYVTDDDDENVNRKWSGSITKDDDADEDDDDDDDDGGLKREKVREKELRKCSIIENVGILCLINRDFRISQPILTANPIPTQSNEYLTVSR